MELCIKVMTTKLRTSNLLDYTTSDVYCFPLFFALTSPFLPSSFFPLPLFIPFPFPFPPSSISSLNSSSPSSSLAYFFFPNTFFNLFALFFSSPPSDVSDSDEDSSFFPLPLFTIFILPILSLLFLCLGRLLRPLSPLLQLLTIRCR